MGKHNSRARQTKLTREENCRQLSAEAKIVKKVKPKATEISVRGCVVEA